MTKAPWVVAGVGLAALLGVVLLRQPADASTHPTPRPGITAERVVPASLAPRTPGAAEAYAAAREAAATLDGVYCYCDCSKHARHRSLLTCFESEHGAYCDICMGEAMLASGMAKQGKSLTEIRTAIDRQFGS
jgi:hypothetical protein